MIQISRAITSDVSGMFAESLAGKSDENEDYVYCQEVGGLRVGAVCDGMGGMDQGKEASKRAAEKFVEGVCRVIRNFGGRFLSSEFRERSYMEVVGRCHERVRSIGGLGEESGTTLSAIVIGPEDAEGRFVDIVHIGDSRCYRIRKGADWPELLTEDHTLTGNLHRSGSIEIHEIPKVQGRNILKKFVGDRASSPVDVSFHQGEDGDVYILCCDGVWGWLHEESGMWLPEGKLASPDSAVKMVKESIDRGSDDNCSALIVGLGD